MEQKWATKDAIFKLTVPKKRHTIEGLGDVWVHGLTSGEKDAYENDVIKVTAGTREIRMMHARAVLIQRTVRDQHGKLLFAEKEIGRIEMIPATVLDPIYDDARKMSGMLTGRVDEVAELVKNSETLRDLDSDTE